MDKISFARMINLLTLWGMRELTNNEMNELNTLTTPVSTKILSSHDVNELMRCMQSGNSKIEAVKAYRSLTNEGLKESKDAVEKYWSGGAY